LTLVDLSPPPSIGFPSGFTIGIPRGITIGFSLGIYYIWDPPKGIFYNREFSKNTYYTVGNPPKGIFYYRECSKGKIPL
jgi:hypothetical protein